MKKIIILLSISFMNLLYSQGPITTNSITVTGRAVNDAGVTFSVPVGEYNAIRTTNDAGGIHFFSPTWKGGDNSMSAGAINFSPNVAVTFGDWTKPFAYFRKKDGFVGIGTANPGAKLDVFAGSLGTNKGDVLKMASFRGTNANHAQLEIFQKRQAAGNDWTNSSLRMQLTTDSTPQGYIEFNSIPSPQGDKLGSIGAVSFGYGNQEFLHINSGGGYVGIGTINPDERLTVKGTVHAQEVKVDLQIPADYVFQKYYTGQSSLKTDYQLPTLQEIEAFTKENHHLPDLPSAREIQENGLLLGQMNNLLLQKIEELTLYAIEQDKIIQLQEKQLLIQIYELGKMKEDFNKQEERLKTLEVLISKNR